MQKNIMRPSPEKPLPLIVAHKWDFKLGFHVAEGEHFYAIEDWIAGITESNARKAQIAWRDFRKRDVSLRLTSLPHLGPDSKQYQKDHTNDHGLYLIAQNLRVTKNRPALREIKDYLAKAGVFADNLRTNKDGARDKGAERGKTGRGHGRSGRGVSEAAAERLLDRHAAEGRGQPPHFQQQHG
ncbi:MAG: hypothetical protein B6245_15090 [Desulfobacteraceae bacterium 4572_88]|nr:MAG: hypothetical protein B6245_15090 [Desulfobacteraceae bacterium 4572_88]